MNEPKELETISRLQGIVICLFYLLMSSSCPILQFHTKKARANLIRFMRNGDRTRDSMALDIAFPIPYRKVFNLCCHSLGNYILYKVDVFVRGGIRDMLRGTPRTIFFAIWQSPRWCWFSFWSHREIDFALIIDN